MPKDEINYQNTIIYKIICKDLNIQDIYIGHTTNFIQRKHSHKQDSKTYSTKIYDIIRAYGGWKNWEMIEIEKYPCKDRNEAMARERFYYDVMHPSMNTYRPVITREEETDKTNESSIKYSKSVNGKATKQRYYQKNKELFIERVRQQRDEKKSKPIAESVILTKDSIEDTTKSRIAIVRVPFPALHFLIWTKKMTCITVDIRDTTGEYTWEGISKNKQRK